MSGQQQTPTVDLAVQHFNAGRLSEAERVCEKILRKDPDHPVTLHLLGVITHRLGRNEAAADLIAKALDLRPDMTAAHFNHALALTALGRLDEAIASYRKALALKPDYPEAHNNIGNALQNLQRPKEAVASFQAALALKPNYAAAHNNLGLALRDLGELGEAMASYHKALAIMPKYAEAHANLGLVLQEMGNPEEAVTSYRRALDFQPGYARIYSNLGASLQSLGRVDEAMASYRKALELQPDLAEAHNNLGNALQDHGNLEEAITRYRQAVALEPENDLFAANFAASLRSVSISSVDENLYQDLSRLLQRPKLPPSYLARSVIEAVRHHPDFARIVAVVGAEAQITGEAYGDIAEQLSGIPLFLQILKLSPIVDLEIERLLTHLRRLMLREITGPHMANRVAPFTAALAHNCFTNEYIFPETEEEQASIEQVQQRIAGLLESRQAVPPSLVIALAAYRPLYEFPWAQQLSDSEWDSEIKSVLRRQITEPSEERALGMQIPRITAIEDSISQAVRQQYEENPYPRWIKAGLAHKNASPGEVLRGSPLFFDVTEDSFAERPEILMAGCGTGQHTLYMTSRFANAEVLALDLSLNSLSYAKRKTAELGFTNIEYAQGDILQLGALGRQFDVIGCAGVLHHLGDPLAGWHVLADLLRPGGVMKIGLYSETARKHLIAGRSLIAEKGYSTSPEDIRRCRQDIISLAATGNAEMAKICHGEEFFSLSQCRDLLFHVQEQRFTLLEIATTLESLELIFLGFEFDNRRTLGRFKQLHPDRGAPASLSLWHEFELENPDTFAGMYQFWCQKS
ncbi:MAG: tetratricopeptide repeat protein [Proteobacteria bacterium]|nr:tetratricopeptide repeat protein [Pseudomonadota bacterium]MDA1356842.1 tetratricopeptide repeat protein [Pseudomonadota bacterium]